MDGTIKTDEILIMLPDFPNADVPTAMGIFFNIVKDPVKVGSKQDNPLSEMLGDTFWYFIVYPDKIELMGAIDIAKLHPSLTPNILQQKGRKVSLLMNLLVTYFTGLFVIVSTYETEQIVG